MGFFRSLDPTCRGRARWATQWKPALNAFAIAFDGRPLHQPHNPAVITYTEARSNTRTSVLASSGDSLPDVEVVLGLVGSVWARVLVGQARDVFRPFVRVQASAGDGACPCHRVSDGVCQVTDVPQDRGAVLAADQ